MSNVLARGLSIFGGGQINPQPGGCDLRRARSQLPATRPTLRGMDSVNPAPNDRADVPRPETEVERQRRLAWEAEMIAKARAELDAGLYATSAEVKAWIDSIGTDHELPVPYPRHPRR